MRSRLHLRDAGQNRLAQLAVQFERGGIAHGAVMTLNENCWSTDPEVIEGEEEDGSTDTEAEVNPEGEAEEEEEETKQPPKPSDQTNSTAAGETASEEEESA